MTAKKTIIQELREEIKELKQQLFKAQTSKELMLQQAKRDYDRRTSDFNSTIAYLGNQIGHINTAFEKEFMWVNLSDDNDTPVAFLKSTLQAMQSSINRQIKKDNDRK